MTELRVHEVGGLMEESKPYEENTQRSMESIPIVYVVDDDPAVLESVSMVADTVGLECLTFSSGQDFLQNFERKSPGCVVLDVRMPGRTGLEVQQALCDRHEDIPVIMITGHGDIPMAVEAMRRGAFHFLQKPFRSQELCDAIRKAVDKDVSQWGELQRRRQARQSVATLTQVEREVMDRVAAGKTNRVIATELGCSVRAVEDRRARVMRKVGAENLEQLISLHTMLAD